MSKTGLSKPSKWGPSLKPPIPQLPLVPDPDTKKLIDQIAGYANENGTDFENMMKTQNAQDPKFSFLFKNHKWNDYYEWRKEQIIKPVALTTSEFNELNKMLSDLDGSRDCIKTGCSWILNHKKSIIQISNILSEFVTQKVDSNDFDKRLFVCYIINDVLHEVMSDRPPMLNDKNNNNGSNSISNNINNINNMNDEEILDFVSIALHNALTSILPNCYKNGQNSNNRSKLDSLLKLWQNRCIFSNNTTAKLRNRMMNNHENANVAMNQIRGLPPQPQVPQMPTIPQMPQMSRMPHMPHMAQMGQMPQIPQMGQMQQMQQMGQMPPIPQMSSMSQIATMQQQQQQHGMTATSLQAQAQAKANALQSTLPGFQQKMAFNQQSNHIGMPSFPTPVALTAFAKDSFGINIGLITEIALELRRTGKGGIYVPIPIDKLPPFRPLKDEATIQQEKITKNIPQVYANYKSDLEKILNMANSSNST